MRRTRPLSIVLLLIVGGLIGACGEGIATPGPSTPGPPTPHFSGAVEPLASYDGQQTCDPTPKPGVETFRDLVLATYPGTTDLGIARGCEVGGTSEHKEGRAWDWGVPAGDARAAALLDWLLASDDQDNRWALARRLGVMYVVFDRQTWKAYQAEQGWQVYSGDDPHTDHVHFSFGWPGARAETSFYADQ